MTKKHFKMFADLFAFMYNKQEATKKPVELFELEIEVKKILKSFNERFDNEKWDSYMLKKTSN